MLTFIEWKWQHLIALHSPHTAHTHDTHDQVVAECFGVALKSALSHRLMLNAIRNVQLLHIWRTVFAIRIRRKFISSICLLPPSLDECIASLHVTIHSRITTRSNSSTLYYDPSIRHKQFRFCETFFFSIFFLLFFFCNRLRWVSEAYMFLAGIFCHRSGKQWARNSRLRNNDSE